MADLPGPLHLPLERAYTQETERTVRRVPTWVIYLILFSAIGGVLIVMPMFYATAPLERAFARSLQSFFVRGFSAEKACRYVPQMGPELEDSIKSFVKEHDKLLKALRQKWWPGGPLSEADLHIAAVFQVACVMAKIYPPRACGYEVILHPQCKDDITTVNLAAIRSWMMSQARVFLPVIQDNHMVLPFYILWIEFMPEPFGSWASAGAVLADIENCDGDFNKELSTFNLLKLRLASVRANETSPTFWFKGTAEQMYWAYRLFKFCEKEGLHAIDYNQDYFLEQLDTFIRYVHGHS